ncbi:MAG: low molecular weight protein-tyrosine-phosphatase [Acidimicrobiales bacterium]
MAEVVLRRLSQQVGLSERISVSSAGTGPWHEGEPMDPRARDALGAAGYDDHGHVAHQFDPSRFDQLDLVVGLDRRHRQTLASLAGDRAVGDRLVLLRSFDPEAGGAVDVPDPYYGEAADFARCLGLVEAGCRGLATALVELLGVPGSLTGPSGPEVPT